MKDVHPHHQPPQPPQSAKYIAEFVGTFFLVFTIGCNAGGIGAAVSIGFMLMVMVYAMGSVSGAHFNPAVTLAVLISGRNKISGLDAIFYMCSQVAGGLAATLLRWVSLPGDLPSLAPVHQVYTHGDVFVLEAIYTWALCYVVLNVATTESKEQGNAPNGFFGLAIGFTVTSAAIAIGPISGCSLNPAVSLGAAYGSHLMSRPQDRDFWYLYIAGPFVGSLVGAFTFFLVQGGMQSRFEYAEREKMIPEPVKPAPEPLPSITPRTVIAMEESLPPTSLNLAKLDPVRLPADVNNHDVFCGLQWRTKSGRKESGDKPCDIDLSCVKFKANGDCLGAVYFAKKEDFVNGIRHSGDEVGFGGHKGHFDNEIIAMKLGHIKPHVHALIFVMTIYTTDQNLTDVEVCTVRLVDQTDNRREYARFQKKDMQLGTNACIAAMLYRTGNTWSFCAIDECHTVPPHSSYRKLIPNMQKYCTAKPEDGEP